MVEKAKAIKAPVTGALAEKKKEGFEMEKIGSFELTKNDSKFEVTNSEMDFGTKLVFVSSIIELLAIEAGVSQEEFVAHIIDANNQFPGNAHIDLGDL